MTPLAALLALCASLSWGISDWGGGLLARRVPSSEVVFWSAVWIPPVLAGALLICGTSPSAHLLIVGAAAGVVGAIGLTLFYRALSLGAMGIAAPITAASVAIPVIVDVARGHLPSALTTVGIVIAVVGIVWLARSEAHETTQLSSSSRRTAILYSLGALVCFGWFLTMTGSADVDGTSEALWLVVGVRTATTVSAVAMLILGRHGLHAGRGDRVRSGVVGGFDAAANGMYAAAAGMAALGPTAVLASLYPVVTVLLAVLMLGERLTRSQTVAAATVVAGAALVSATA